MFGILNIVRIQLYELSVVWDEMLDSSPFAKCCSIQLMNTNAHYSSSVWPEKQIFLLVDQIASEQQGKLSISRMFGQFL